MSLNPEADRKADPLAVKWERRKRPSTAFAPSLRSGCTMTMWPAKGLGIMFGGVTDEDKHEETLESVFHNDLYGYQASGNGRWVSMLLKKPKQEKGKKKKADQTAPVKQKPEREGSDDEEYKDEDEDEVRCRAAVYLFRLIGNSGLAGERQSIKNSKTQSSPRAA